MDQLLEELLKKCEKCDKDQKYMVILGINISREFIKYDNITMKEIVTYYDENIKKYQPKIIRKKYNFFIKKFEKIIIEVPTFVKKFFIDLWNDETKGFKKHQKDNIWLYVINLVILIKRWKEVK